MNLERRSGLRVDFLEHMVFDIVSLNRAVLERRQQVSAFQVVVSADTL